MSSDMARPVVVTDVTAATGAGFGPVQNHGLRSYSVTQGNVKEVLLKRHFRANAFAFVGSCFSQPESRAARGPTPAARTRWSPHTRTRPFVRLLGYRRNHRFSFDNRYRACGRDEGVDLLFDPAWVRIHEDLDLQRLWHLAPSKIPRRCRADRIRPIARFSR